MSDVLATLPTVVVAARDAEGHDTASVRLSIDGKVVADKLDGRPIEIDPGLHSFRLESSAAGTWTEQQELVREGERDRAITLVLPGKAPSSAGGSSASTSIGTATTSATPAPPASHVSTLAWVFGGVAVAALATSLVTYVTELDDYNHLRALCDHSCTGNQTASLYTRDIVWKVSLGVGAVSLAVATYFFFARRGPSPSSAGLLNDLTLSPIAGGYAVGFAKPF
jgi:hypothetical protein